MREARKGEFLSSRARFLPRVSRPSNSRSIAASGSLALSIKWQVFRQAPHTSITNGILSIYVYLSNFPLDQEPNGLLTGLKTEKVHFTDGGLPDQITKTVPKYTENYRKHFQQVLIYNMKWDLGEKKN